LKKIDRYFVGLHRRVRQWDVPVLFGFPSPEKVRLQHRISELEIKNVELVANLKESDAKAVALEELNVELVANLKNLIPWCIRRADSKANSRKREVGKL